MAAIESHIAQISEFSRGMSARLATIEVRLMQNDFQVHEICRVFGNCLVEFKPSGDKGWLLRRVRDTASMGVRALTRTYYVVSNVTNPEDFTKQAYSGMRFVLEEALRRTMLGVRTEKRHAYVRLTITMTVMMIVVRIHCSHCPAKFLCWSY